MLSYRTLANFPACFIYTPFVTLSLFVALSNICRLIKHFLSPCYLFTFYVTYAPYKYTCCTHRTTKLSLSSLFVRTLSVLKHFSNSLGVFGHRTILMWGDRGMTGGFLCELIDTLQATTTKKHAKKDLF